MHSFIYIDSFQKQHVINFQIDSHLNLMELIWDGGYEDWADCRGCAWCGTCHVKVSGGKKLVAPDNEEKTRILQIINRREGDRLACQIRVDEKIDKLIIEYRGDDRCINYLLSAIVNDWSHF